MGVEKYTLKHPVTVGDKTISVLELDCPTQKKLEDAGLDYADISKPKGYRMLVIAGCTNAIETHINKMHPADIIEAGGIVKDFLFD